MFPNSDQPTHIPSWTQPSVTLGHPSGIHCALSSLLLTRQYFLGTKCNMSMTFHGNTSFMYVNLGTMRKVLGKSL